MEWIKLEIEVLAANFKKSSYGYKEKNMGYLYKEGLMICCDGDELLENCTHYIDINKHDIEPT